MKKSKKLFGILNWVDIVLILIVILAGFVGYRMFFASTPISQVEQKTYTYVVEGQRVLAETANFPEIGASVYNSSTTDYLGVITDVQTEPYSEVVYSQTTNEYLKIPTDNYINIRVAISGTGTETDGNITVEGSTIPKVGKELNVKGKGFAYKGIIVEVRDGE